MYILKIAPNNPEATALEDRLRQLSLGFKTEKVQDLEEPQLYDHELIAAGIEDISAHLDELAGELHQWYYCNC